ncbi:MAG TPA: DUF92 domain-containing protein [Acidobacteriaceae bacterium]|nr:DUF92 domain-containing protein [Acidobacteriaceae bacterium]
MSHVRQSAARLRWQSQAALYVVVGLGWASIALQCVTFWRAAPERILQAIALGALLAIVIFWLRAATPAAAITGGICAAALYLATPGLRTALWPLLALLILTLAATRFGRESKANIDGAEQARGRNAAQVAANLGVAVLASVPLGLARIVLVPRVFGGAAMRLALAAALAEAAADTLSSEFGEVLGGEPRLLTTFRRVAAGTDGAISAAGTLAGICGAVVVAVAAALAMNLSPGQGALVALVAAAGLFIDSLLGAVLERRGWLNNDAVNFLSSLAAAALAAWIGSRY